MLTDMAGGSVGKMFCLQTAEHVGRGRNWHRTVFCGGLLYSGLKNIVNSYWVIILLELFMVGL